MFNLFSTTSKAYRDLRGTEFREQLVISPNSVLIDVRTVGEFASGTIPGAKNIDFLSPGFREIIRKMDKSKNYFLFCRSGSRSAQACAIMAKEGFNVTNLRGGIGEWP